MPDGMSEGCGVTAIRCRRGDYRKAERERKKAMEPFTIKSQARDKPY